MDFNLSLCRKTSFLWALCCAAFGLCLAAPLFAAAQKNAPSLTDAQRKYLDNLNAQADEFLKKKDYAEAEKIAREGVSAAQKFFSVEKTAKEYDCLGMEFDHLGLVLKESGKYSEAEGNFKKALDLCESKQYSVPSLAALAAMHLADVIYLQHDLPRSLALSRKAYDYYKTASDKPKLVASIDNVSFLLSGMNQLKENIPFLEEAAALLAKCGEKSDQVRNFFWLASAYAQEANYPQALINFRKAAAIYEALHDRGDYGVTISAMGAVMLALGEWEDADAAYTDALKTFQETGQDGEAALTALQLRSIAQILGDSDELQIYDALVKKMQPLIEKAPQAPLIHLYQGWHLTALHKMEQAFAELQVGCDSAKTPQDKAFGHQFKALWYEGNREYDRAETEFNAAAATYEQLGNLSSLFAISGCRGNLYIHQKKYAAAKVEIEKSLKQKEVANNPVLEGSAHLSLGAVAYYQADYNQANFELETAAKFNETQYKALRSPAQIGAFQQSNDNHLFGLWAMSLWKQRRPLQALLTAERGRANGLQALLNAGGAAALALPEPARKSGQAAQSNAWQASAQQVDEAAIRKMSRQRPDTLFMETIIVDDDSTLIFALRGGELRVFSLRRGDRDWEAAAENWQQAMQNYALLGDADSGRFDQKQYGAKMREAENKEKLALSAFSELIKPVEKAGLLDAQGVKRLIFVANETLANVPFCALYDRRGQPLFKRFACANSLSLALLCRADVKRKPTANLLCLANPSVALPSDAALSLALRTRRAAPTLRELEKSGREIAALFPHSTIKTGSEANRAAALDMGRYDLLFFGTHGILNTESGLRSFLRLAFDPAKSASERLEARR